MQPLRPGKRTMSVEAVAAHRRRRVMEVGCSIAAEGGFRAMNARQIAARARVSQRDIYGLFGSIHGLRTAVVLWAQEDVARPVCETYERRSLFTAGVIDALRALIARIALRADSARVWFVVSRQAGADEVIHPERVVAAAAAELCAGARAATRQGVTQPPALTCEIMVGGLWEIVSRQLAKGRTDLSPLLPDLVYSLLSVFVAPEVARELAAGAAEPG